MNKYERAIGSGTLAERLMRESIVVMDADMHLPHKVKISNYYYYHHHHYY